MIIMCGAARGDAPPPGDRNRAAESQVGREKHPAPAWCVGVGLGEDALQVHDALGRDRRARGRARVPPTLQKSQNVHRMNRQNR